MTCRDFVFDILTRDADRPRSTKPPRLTYEVALSGRARARRQSASLLTNPGLRCGHWSIRGQRLGAVHSGWTEATYDTATMSADTSSTLGSFYTLAEIANALRVNLRTVIRRLNEGAFPNAFRFGRSVRIPASDLEAYVASQRLHPPTRT